MATAVELGRLVSVPLRQVWAHEANDFTPWLAQPDNLRLLAEGLGLDELQVQGTEVPVGNFAIDILARDRENNVVVIENQFGATDLLHLGQIMTYIAGQEGKVTIVWVAEKFREEHRAAIDWLNSSTIEGFDFFAVEVEALKIGNSAPAPWFNVVAKPNEWSRDVTRKSRNDDRPPDERQKAYISYWAAFALFLADQKAPFKMRNPSTRDYYCNFGNLARPGFSLNAIAGLRDKKISVEIYIHHRAAKAIFDHLNAHRSDIEADFGGQLEWQRLNDRKGCRIAISNTDFDPTNREQWPNQHAWFLDHLERMTRAFRSRIDALDIDELESEQEDIVADTPR
jgi:Domain of unknown function (DUF4268)